MTTDQTPADEQNDKAQEYLDGWKRERAAFENYRKDESQRLAELQIRLARNFLSTLLPILDSFELALKATPTDAKKSDWFAGYEFIKKQYEEMLKEEGIEPIETKDQAFNPYLHEAIEAQAQEQESSDPFIIVEELQKGYRMGDFVLRPARVKVGRRGGDAQ